MKKWKKFEAIIDERDKRYTERFEALALALDLAQQNSTWKIGIVVAVLMGIAGFVARFWK